MPSFLALLLFTCVFLPTHKPQAVRIPSKHSRSSRIKLKFVIALCIVAGALLNALQHMFIVECWLDLLNTHSV